MPLFLFLSFLFTYKMKSSVLIILATLLTTAILAPSVITLTNLDEKAITIDFNEEEKNEEKKEAKEKDFFLDSSLSVLALSEKQKKSISCFCLESDYDSSFAIILPPPEQFV